jgi:hypothetical protein
MCACASYVVRVCARACMRLAQYNPKYVYMHCRRSFEIVLSCWGRASIHIPICDIAASTRRRWSLKTVFPTSFTSMSTSLFVRVCAALHIYLGTCVRVGIVLHICATDMWSSSSAARPCRYIRLCILLFAPRATYRHTDNRVISISDKRGCSQRHTTTAGVMTQMAFQKSFSGLCFCRYLKYS